MTRISRDELFMGMVELLEKRSICNRAKVGAVVVLNNRPISIGYNGPPSGVDVCCQVGDKECLHTIHAEMNAIAWAARLGVSLNGSEMYVSMSPCLACAKVIINSGIRKVYYRDPYRDLSGVQYLSNHIDVEEIIT